MTTKKRGLGKGLNELLAASNLASSLGELGTVSLETQVPILPNQVGELRYLPIEQLQPGSAQPRQQVDLSLEELAESIRAQGVLQPILVRHQGEQYEIVAGERRWRAAQLAALSHVPVIVRNINDETAMMVALIENIQRENLNPIEEAQALKRLSEKLELTHLQIAEGIGKSRTSVTNLLRLLNLNPEVQTVLADRKLEMGHARALLSLKGPMQSRVAQMVVQRGLSVRETERLVGKLQENKTAQSPKIVIDPNIRRLEEDLADKLGAKVLIRHGRKGEGMVVIRYHDVNELEGILAHIK